MNIKSAFLTVLLILSTQNAFANATTELSLTAGVKAIDGSTEEILCSETAVKLYPESSEFSVAQAVPFSEVQEIQSFGTDQREDIIEGKLTRLTHVLIVGENVLTGQSGWVDSAVIRLTSTCEKFVRAEQSLNNEDGAEWIFPTIQRPTDSYLTGQRRFGANRQGRIHAACDLYRKENEGAVSINDGVVIRGLHDFYQGTFAIEVRYNNGEIVRYGEVTGRKAPLVTQGSTLRKGQIIGYIGKVNSNCCSPMLHLEAYSGKATGSLSQKGVGPYGRRSDLINPTSFLQSLEKKTFGTSY